MRILPIRRRLAATLTLAAPLVASVAVRARAQTPARTILEITARDSSGAPVPGAELTVTRGLREVLARSTTDSTGFGRLVVTGLVQSTDLAIAMRKIGYTRGDKFISVIPRDSINMTMVVSKPYDTLATVKVTAHPDPKWRSYHVDADDIMNSTMSLSNGWDVVKRLAPSMLTSRGGCNTGAQEIWVDGARIRLPLPASGTAATRARIDLPFHAKFSSAVVAVLSEIAPEHIESIEYHDCFDTSAAVIGYTNAIFVTLKPGVTYVRDIGSFVLDPVETQRRAP